MKDICLIINLAALVLTIEGVSKTVSVLIIVSVALANYFDGRLRAENNLKK